MQITKKRFVALLTVTFLAGAAVSAGVAAVLKAADSDKYAKLDKLMETAEKYYYSDINEDDMIDGACKGLIAGLGDPYSAYITAEEYEAFEASVTGEYSGIGVTFTEDDDGNYVIVSVEDGSPAAEAGLKADDIIMAVNGKTYDDMELMAADIRGEEGTEVEIQYIRDEKKNSVKVKRSKIVQHSVKQKMLDSDTGYIEISSFIESTYDDFKKALDKTEAAGADNLVLDLRDNGGGLVEACVNVADEFLDEGIVVYTEDKNGKRSDIKAEDGKTELNVAVLVNENSASAAEILAAALQDNGIKIVGTKTFGKGVIQSTEKLDDGSAIKLTVMQYYSPKGNEINKLGVKPDYEVTNTEDSSEDKQLQKAQSLF